MYKKRPILIIGGGHQGMAMAAHFALSGEQVYLWNRSENTIIDILKNGTVECTGIITGTARIEKISCDISEVFCDTIMMTVPAFAHQNIAQLLAPIVTHNTKIILNPGRTYGALEFRRALKRAGCKEFPQIAETQTIVYTCRRTHKNNVEIYALKDNVKIAALSNESLSDIINIIPACIRSHFVTCNSTIYTSLGNIGMVLHCAPVLMNIGWIESSETKFKYYYEGISQTIAFFLEKIDNERIMIAQKLGYHIDSVTNWLESTYHIHENSLYDCLRNNNSYKEIDAPKTLNHRYLEEDIPYGLVPLEQTGKIIGVNTPCVSLIIELASAIQNKNYRALGRYITEEELKEICKYS